MRSTTNQPGGPILSDPPAGCCLPYSRRYEGLTFKNILNAFQGQSLCCMLCLCVMSPGAGRKNITACHPKCRPSSLNITPAEISRRLGGKDPLQCSRAEWLDRMVFAGTGVAVAEKVYLLRGGRARRFHGGARTS